MTAEVIMYAVKSHAMRSMPFSSAMIVGIAVPTIVWSSEEKNIVTITAASAIHLRFPVIWFVVW